MISSLKDTARYRDAALRVAVAVQLSRSVVAGAHFADDPSGVVRREIWLSALALACGGGRRKRIDHSLHGVFRALKNMCDLAHART